MPHFGEICSPRGTGGRGTYFGEICSPRGTGGGAHGGAHPRGARGGGAHGGAHDAILVKFAPRGAREGGAHGGAHGGAPPVGICTAVD